MHSMLVLRRCQENPDTICPVYRQGCMVAIRATFGLGLRWAIKQSKASWLKRVRTRMLPG